MNWIVVCGAAKFGVSFNKLTFAFGVGVGVMVVAFVIVTPVMDVSCALDNGVSVGVVDSA